MSYYDPYYDPYYASGYQGYPAAQPTYQPTTVPVATPTPSVPGDNISMPTPSISPTVPSPNTVTAAAPSLMDTLDKYKFIIIGVVCLIVLISISISVIFFTSSSTPKPAPNDKLNTTSPPLASTPVTQPSASTTSPPGITTPATSVTSTTVPPVTSTTVPPVTTKQPTQLTPSSVFCNDNNLRNIILKYPYWVSNDQIAAVNILANITDTVPSSLQSMSNLQLYRLLKDKCKL